MTRRATSHDEGVKLSDAQIAAAGIELLPAGPRELRDTLRLNGMIQPNQEALVKVTPRFPGIVRSMRKRLGDKVRKDEVLATVESNQSLTTYELKAPIDGTVIDRDGTLGRVRLRAEAALHRRRPVDHVDRPRRLPPRLRARADRAMPWRSTSRMAGRPIEAKIDYVSPLGASDTQILDRARRRGQRRPAAARPVRRRPRPAVGPTGRGRRQDRARSRRWRARPWCSCARATTSRRARSSSATAMPTGSRSGSASCRATSMPRKNSFVIKAEIGKASAAHEH